MCIRDRAGGAGPSDTPGDLAELKKILWRHARGADKNHSIKATEVLHRLAAHEREQGMALADDGFGQERSARDFILQNPNGAVAYVLLLSGQGLALSCLPMLNDLAPKAAALWPEVWERLVEKQSSTMREDLSAKLGR